jgi:hypothetical protein
MITEQINQKCDEMIALFKESKLGAFEQIIHLEDKHYRIKVEQLSKGQVKRLEMEE